MILPIILPSPPRGCDSGSLSTSPPADPLCRATTVKLVAFDASDQLLADLRSGAIDSLVVQNPFRMGHESTRAIGLKLAGQTPPAQIDSGTTLVRREDLDRPEIRGLLHPDIERYLRNAN